MNSPWNVCVADWLAGLFMGPLSIDTIDSYRNDIGAVLLDEIDEGPGAAPGIRLMRSALGAQASASAVQRDLESAFTQLFDGVAGPNTVSLYESSYIGGSGRLFQESVDDMNRLLRQLNLSSDTAFREPPDHLSVELAVLGRLMRRGSSQEAQAGLLDQHLLAWIPSFARRCRLADPTGFYAGAASVLSAFLSQQRMGLRRGGRVGRTSQPQNGVMPCRS